MFNDLCTLLSAFLGGCIIIMFFSWAYFGIKGMYFDSSRRATEAKIRQRTPSGRHVPADPEEEDDGSILHGLAVAFGTTLVLWFLMEGHPLDPNVVEMNQHWPWWLLGPEAGVIYYIHKKVGGVVFLVVLACAALQVFVMIQTNNPQWHDSDLFEIVRTIGDWLVSVIRAPFQLLKRLFGK